MDKKELRENVKKLMGLHRDLVLGGQEEEEGITEFKKMEWALLDGKIVCLLERDDGRIEFFAAYDNEDDAISSAYTSDNPAVCEAMPRQICVKIYNFAPRHFI